MVEVLLHARFVKSLFLGGSLFFGGYMMYSWYAAGSFIELWLTPDQRGQLAYNNRDFPGAAELFFDPNWKGAAQYASGQYVEAADTFATIPNAEGFFNRGNAFMKSGDYGKAIKAYEVAAEEAPEWIEARENLELARHVLFYIEDTREQSDTGDESELSADDYKFDNTDDRGQEMQITRKETVEMQTAEKWMRSVSTEVSDYLRTRFALENTRREP